MQESRSFRLIRSRLRTSGFAGETRVRLADGVVRIVGEDGAVDIPVSAITRLRLGFDTTRYSGRIYQMLLWTDRTSRPLRLASVRADRAEFADVARRLAAAVAAARGLGAVEGGLSWPAALTNAILLPPLILISIWYGPTFFGPETPLIFKIALPACLLAYLMLATVHLIYFDRPRSLRDLAEADRYLPTRP